MSMKKAFNVNLWYKRLKDSKIRLFLRNLITLSFWSMFTINLILAQSLVKKISKQLFFIADHNMDGINEIFIRDATKKERQFLWCKLKMVLALEDSLRLSGKTDTLLLISLIAIHSCSTLLIKESLSADLLKTQS
jgi:hypothetical protein